MAEFKEELIINALHPEKAEIGKKYYFADTLRGLKEKVEGGSVDITNTLEMIDCTRGHFFIDKENISWEFLYPYDPSKHRMTRGQLLEWLSKGFGLWEEEQKEKERFGQRKNEIENELLTQRRKIEELEKENCKLQGKLTDLENFKDNEIAKLKEQIEEMKCCGNCYNSLYGQRGENGRCEICGNKDQWELGERISSSRPLFSNEILKNTFGVVNKGCDSEQVGTFIKKTCEEGISEQKIEIDER